MSMVTVVAPSHSRIVKQVRIFVITSLIELFFLPNTLSHSMCCGPLFCGLYGSWLILLPSLSNIVGKRVVRVGGSKQRLNREQDCADLQGRRPIVCK